MAHTPQGRPAGRWRVHVPHHVAARIKPRERMSKRLFVPANRSAYRSDTDSGTGKRCAATSAAVL